MSHPCVKIASYKRKLRNIDQFSGPRLVLNEPFIEGLLVRKLGLLRFECYAIIFSFFELGLRSPVKFTKIQKKKFILANPSNRLNCPVPIFSKIPVPINSHNRIQPATGNI
jgi:hypothetical protein